MILLYQQHQGLLWRTERRLKMNYLPIKGVQTTALGSSQMLKGKIEEKVTQLIFALLAMDIHQLQTDFDIATSWQGAHWQLNLTPNQH